MGYISFLSPSHIPKLTLRGIDADGIAAAITISLVNYVLLGLQLPVDGFYMHSFEIWLATAVVFYGSGNVGFTLLEYRLGEKELVRVSLQFLLGLLSIKLTQP